MNFWPRRRLETLELRAPDLTADHLYKFERFAELGGDLGIGVTLLGVLHLPQHGVEARIGWKTVGVALVRP